MIMSTFVSVFVFLVSSVGLVDETWGLSVVLGRRSGATGAAATAPVSTASGEEDCTETEAAADTSSSALIPTDRRDQNYAGGQGTNLHDKDATTAASDQSSTFNGDQVTPPEVVSSPRARELLRENALRLLAEVHAEEACRGLFCSPQNNSRQEEEKSQQEAGAASSSATSTAAAAGNINEHSLPGSMNPQQPTHFLRRLLDGAARTCQSCARRRATTTSSAADVEIMLSRDQRDRYHRILQEALSKHKNRWYAGTAAQQEELKANLDKAYDKWTREQLPALKMKEQGELQYPAEEQGAGRSASTPTGDPGLEGEDRVTSKASMSSSSSSSATTATGDVFHQRSPSRKSSLSTGFDLLVKVQNSFAVEDFEHDATEVLLDAHCAPERRSSSGNDAPDDGHDYTIRLPGGATVADVMEHLEQDTPKNRPCTYVRKLFLPALTQIEYKNGTTELQPTNNAFGGRMLNVRKEVGQANAFYYETDEKNLGTLLIQQLRTSPRILMQEYRRTGLDLLESENIDDENLPVLYLREIHEPRRMVRAKRSRGVADVVSSQEEEGENFTTIAPTSPPLETMNLG
ncbi:unnamed protein product [Amoebophrya sp. A120]|nr:unnamed protein product [Amoebophrya sp. A120]|eukprot:GSA120T00001022001.1